MSEKLSTYSAARSAFQIGFIQSFKASALEEVVASDSRLSSLSILRDVGVVLLEFRGIVQYFFICILKLNFFS